MPSRSFFCRDVRSVFVPLSKFFLEKHYFCLYLNLHASGSNVNSSAEQIVLPQYLLEVCVLALVPSDRYSNVAILPSIDPVPFALRPRDPAAAGGTANFTSSRLNGPFQLRGRVSHQVLGRLFPQQRARVCVCMCVCACVCGCMYLLYVCVCVRAWRSKYPPLSPATAPGGSRPVPAGAPVDSCLGNPQTALHPGLPPRGPRASAAAHPARSPRPSTLAAGAGSEGPSRPVRGIPRL